jgi:uncharacterized membrane protein YkoI
LIKERERNLSSNSEQILKVLKPEFRFHTESDDSFEIYLNLKLIFMKHHALVTVTTFMFLALAAYGQKVNEDKLPAETKEAFKQKYPGTLGKWEKENGNYEVNFKKDGKTMSAVIDSKGAFLETETGISVTELPAGIESYIKSHYKGAAIKEAARIVKANGETVYEADVNKKDVLFDANGKFIKEAND